MDVKIFDFVHSSAVELIKQYRSQIRCSPCRNDIEHATDMTNEKVHIYLIFLYNIFNAEALSGLMILLLNKLQNFRPPRVVLGIGLPLHL